MSYDENDVTYDYNPCPSEIIRFNEKLIASKWDGCKDTIFSKVADIGEDQLLICRNDFIEYAVKAQLEYFKFSYLELTKEKDYVVIYFDHDKKGYQNSVKMKLIDDTIDLEDAKSRLEDYIRKELKERFN